jgi:hypothetical protein
MEEKSTHQKLVDKKGVYYHLAKDKLGLKNKIDMPEINNLQVYSEQNQKLMWFIPQCISPMVVDCNIQSPFSHHCRKLLF